MNAKEIGKKIEDLIDTVTDSLKLKQACIEMANGKSSRDYFVALITLGVTTFLFILGGESAVPLLVAAVIVGSAIMTVGTYSKPKQGAPKRDGCIVDFAQENSGEATEGEGPQGKRGGENPTGKH
jgi:hypothetical protein